MQEIHGNLSKTSLPQILHNIYIEPDPYAVLDISRGQTLRHFFFKNGLLIAATSNVLNEVIGRLLVAEKVITQTEYELSLEKVVKEKQRHGEVLISMGLITSTELNKFLADQFKRRLWKAMGLPDGEFNCRHIETVSPSMTQEPAHPAFLILEGISHGFYPAQRLENDLQPLLNTSFKAATYTGRYQLSDFDLNMQEKRFLKAFDGQKTLAQNIGSSNLLHHRAQALAMTFIITGMVRLPKVVSEAAAETDISKKTTGEPIAAQQIQTVSVVESTEQLPSFEVEMSMTEPVETQPPVTELSAAQPADTQPPVLGLSEIQPAQKPVVAVQTTPSTPNALFNAERLFLQAKAALNSNDYPSALELFKQISNLNPQEAEYKTYLAWTLYNQNRAEAFKAGDTLREVLAKNPDLPDAWHFLGNIYLASGFPEAAEKAFRMAMSLNIRLLNTLCILKLQEYKKTARLPEDTPARQRYMEYYGFLEDPFNEIPDSRYFFTHTGAAAVLDNILDAVKKQTGHIFAQGAPGSGKTFTAFELLRRLSDEKIMAAFLLNSIPEKRLLLKAIDTEFRCYTAGSLKDDLLSLTMAVEQNHLHGGHAIIIVDNANELPDECLLLLGELMRHKYLQVILFGLPALTGRLYGPALRELNSKLTMRLTISQIAVTETQQYLEKRVNTAPKYVLSGANNVNAFFNESAAGRLHSLSGGTLKLLTRLAARTLNIAATLGKTSIDNDVLQAVSADFKGNPISEANR